MASFRKIGEGKWRAEVARMGTRRSKVFPTKRAAQDWAARQEFLIEEGSDAPKTTPPLSEMVGRYELEVMPKKKTRWNSRGSEMYVLKLILQDEIAALPIGDITPADLVSFRDRRLLTVSPASAQRYMNTLASIFTAAAKDWGIIADNPMRNVRRPKPAPARNRRPTAEEIKKLSVAAGDPSTISGRVHVAFMFAIETGMRAHEIATLSKANVDTERRVAHLPRTKNGQPRDVPLSKEAVRLLSLLPEADPVFGIAGGPALSNNWYLLRQRADVVGLTFHDSRHEAITRLSKKVDVLALARMVGHSNIKQLMTYYNETAEELAKLLD